MYYFNYSNLLLQDSLSEKYIAFNRSTKEKSELNRDLFLLLSQLHEDTSIAEEKFNSYGKEFVDELFKRQLISRQPSEVCSNIRSVDSRHTLKRVFLEISKKCNLYCSHCYADASGQYADALEKDKIFSVIDQAAELGAYDFLITGGEPLLRPDITEILNYLWIKGFSITLFTNLTHLREDHIKAIKKFCVSVITSIDFLDEKKHDEFRGAKGALSLTINNLKKLRANHVNMRVNTIINGKTDGEINSLINYIKFELQLPYAVDIIIPRGRGKKIPGGKTADGIKLYAYLTANAMSDDRCNAGESSDYDKDCIYAYNCHMGRDFFFIGADGEAALCPSLNGIEGDRFSFGNVQDEPLSQLWFNTKRLAFADVNCAYVNECPRSGQCGGGCRSKAYHFGGDIKGPDPIMCGVYEIDTDNIRKEVRANEI